MCIRDSPESICPSLSAPELKGEQEVTRYDILTAIPTAFHRDGSLDLDGSRSIFRYVAKSGNEGAFVLGTTGEFPAVNATEFAAIVEIAMQELAAAMRVVVHVGQPSSYEAVARVKTAQQFGATEFAALTPYLSLIHI